MPISPSSNSEIWSWEALFEEIDSFILSSGRQLGQCSESETIIMLIMLCARVFVTTLTV